jgi:hypothetical protein
MDRHDKLYERFRRRPRDFTWDELTTLLRRLGFRQVRPGRTGGHDAGSSTRTAV